jgi:Holliday junction resolvase
MTPEKKVKNKVVALLKDAGAYCFYPVAGGYGSAGIPDIIACYMGKFIAIECKAGKGKTTALQDRNIAQIKDAGGFAIVVNEENLIDVQEILNHITQEWRDQNGINS